jgi:hypothetical protein
MMDADTAPVALRFAVEKQRKVVIENSQESVVTNATGRKRHADK